MTKTKLITDAASDLSPEDEKRYDIRVIPFNVVLDGKDYVPRVEIDNDEFYKLMLASNDLPKTAQVNPAEFVEIYWEEVRKGAENLIVVLINSEGSSTYANSVMAVDMFFDEHPEYRDRVHIYPVDGMGYSALYGAPVVDAAKRLESGVAPAQVAEELKALMPHRQIYFGIYALKWAGKSGRIPTAAAFIGDKLNLKPVMKIFDSQITTAAKVRGESKLIPRICEMALADMEPNTPYQLIYGSDPTVLTDLERIMQEKTGYPPEGRYQISAVIAANSGPKISGIAFTRKK